MNQRLLDFFRANSGPAAIGLVGSNAFATELNPLKS